MWADQRKMAPHSTWLFGGGEHAGRVDHTRTSPVSLAKKFSAVTLRGSINVSGAGVKMPGGET